VAQVFEEGIRAHPQDWHMLQRVFVADLDLARLAAAEAKARAAAEDGNGLAGDGAPAGGKAALNGQHEGTGR